MPTQYGLLRANLSSLCPYLCVFEFDLLGVGLYAWGRRSCACHFKAREVFPVHQIEVYLGIPGRPERTADFRCGATIVILFEGVLPIDVHLAKGESCMTGAELYSELFHAVRDHWFCGNRTGTGNDVLTALGIASADDFVSRVFMVEQATMSNPSSGGHVGSSSVVQVNLDSTLQTKSVVTCLISKVFFSSSGDFVFI